MLTLAIHASPPLHAWQETLTATEQQLTIAATRALNKTARWARTHIARQTAAALSMNIAPVKKGLQLVRATPSQPRCIVALSPRAGVIHATQLGPLTQNTAGVRAGRKQFNHAFIATMPNGHQGVFRRKGKARLPIQSVNIIITSKMKTIMEDLANGPALQQFEKLFARELRYLLRA